MAHSSMECEWAHDSQQGGRMWARGRHEARACDNSVAVWPRDARSVRHWRDAAQRIAQEALACTALGARVFLRALARFERFVTEGQHGSL
eukprot:11182977-Alexandrium_andersonii.AAC.1